MDIIRFPEQVLVTDQPVDCRGMSEEKKKFVLDFTKTLIFDFSTSGAHRKVYGIAGPSGSGKTFLSVLANIIGKQMDPSIDIVPISIDAFHFCNDYLQMTVIGDGFLRDVKGRYDTYDVDALITSLIQFKEGNPVMFPVYSRKLHDPVQDVISINERPTLLLIEGLWLLFKKSKWGDVNALLDKTYFIDDTAEESMHHVVKRHIMGGKSEDEANRHYNDSDAKNRELVIETRNFADEIIRWPK